MNLHLEKEFENEICENMAQNGWLYANDDAKNYDTPRALYPTDFIDWVCETQPNEWQVMVKNHGTLAQNILLDRLRAQLNQRGTLDVLRTGIDLVGLKSPIKCAQFKPAMAMNPQLMAKYHANRLRVVRQLRTNHDDIIDLVLFLNGIPVATAEIKSNFTQNIHEAVDQYRFERNPKPKGQKLSEPLLEFPCGALVHFAISQSEVMMCTKLQGERSRFLPFNRGHDGGAGNPPADGIRTQYLWQDIWQYDSWLEIIGRYMVTKRDNKKQITDIIFPRYHQLDATRQLITAILADGVGKKYLIQHSAGSGKTNSIAWSAHFLSELHNPDNEKLFSSILVVSDRNILDKQLQEAIFDFQRVHGVVTTIRGDGASKSKELAKALSGGSKIVVCTIQTFPFALKQVRELAATHGKKFAVIADEAHSSQSGAAATKLKQLLSPEEIQQLEDGGEISAEDILAAQMAARVNDSDISYIAFTATPKGKTLELFGRVPNPNQPASKTNLPAPFHIYSMRQAIEEGFIVDVLKNYTSYGMAFKLIFNGTEIDNQQVDKKQAKKLLFKWVRLHDYNISQRVEIVVEHFIKIVRPLLNGQAKAMVVVGSRLEAVRWKLAIDKYIASQNYNLGTLVAFSGEVHDPDKLPEPVNENSKQLNPNLRGRDIRTAFATPEYQILLVANKFQTGFDQPLLCGMYVDKRLAGIQAVQTLSRLNRAHDGKDTTYILDFVNDPAEILQAFQVYYQTAELSDITDPNHIFDLKAKLDARGYYDEFEIERLVAVECNPKSKQSDLVRAIEPIAARLLAKYKEFMNEKTLTSQAQQGMDALIMFKKDMGSFIRIYAFLCQIYDYGNTDIEKRAMFFKRLLPLLEFGRTRDGVDLSKIQLTHHKLINRGHENLALTTDINAKLNPINDVGDGQVHDKNKILLSAILEQLNDLFHGDLTDDDKLGYPYIILKKLLESDILQHQAMNNSKEQFSNSPDLAKSILNAIIDALSAHTSMSRQALDSQKVQMGIKNILLYHINLYESLREKGQKEMAG